MTFEVLWPWVVLLLLGMAHGLNPGMGWLFAVALGAQEGRSRAVWRALLPLAAGHALAVAAALLLLLAAGVMVPADRLRWGVAVVLVALGLFQWGRHRHPRWAGMRVGARDLVAWSFLMATAHGAGVMALPFAMDAGAAVPAAHDHHAAHLAQAAGAASPAAGVEAAALIATLVHGAGYLLVTALVAVVVYERLGLRLLRRAWVNVDRIWAAALVATGGLALLA